MSRFIGNLKRFFSGYRVIATKKRRDRINRRPNLEMLEGRALLSIVGQSSLINTYASATEADNSNIKSYFHSLSQPPTIAPISDASNLSSANPGVPSTATANASVQSSFANSDSDSGHVSITGAFSTQGMINRFDEASAYYLITYGLTVANTSSLPEVLSVSYMINSSGDNFDPNGTVLVYDTDLNAVGSGTGILTYNVPSGSSAYFVIKVNCASLPFMVNDDATSTTAVDVDWSLSQGSFQSSTSLASSSPISQQGQPVKLTATVSPPSAAYPTPTGTVTFVDGATTLGTGVLDASGVAAFTTYVTQPLSIGTHSITAVYTGDKKFRGSTSPPLKQIIQAAPDLAMTSAVISPNSQFVNANYKIQ